MAAPSQHPQLASQAVHRSGAPERRPGAARRSGARDRRPIAHGRWRPHNPRPAGNPLHGGRPLPVFRGPVAHSEGSTCTRLRHAASLTSAEIESKNHRVLSKSDNPLAVPVVRDIPVCVAGLAKSPDDQLGLSTPDVAGGAGNRVRRALRPSPRPRRDREPRPTIHFGSISDVDALGGRRARERQHGDQQGHPQRCWAGRRGVNHGDASPAGVARGRRGLWRPRRATGYPFGVRTLY